MDSEIELSRPQVIPWPRRLSTLPWWAIAILVLGALIALLIYTAPLYQDAFLFLLEGLRLTITITLVSFSIALLLGLLAGLGRVSRSVILRNVAQFYVEVVRGIPLLVLIIYFAFVIAPLLIALINGAGQLMASLLRFPPFSSLGAAMASMDIQDLSTTARAMMGLAFGYGAYEAEVFRAGIESIAKGQMEAARSQGMSYGQAMRYIILPQAIRRVLPPFGNDFISMLKDSSLVSVLAVRELTHLGKLNRARTFRTFETWNTVTFMYLVLTLSLSLLVKLLEKRMGYEE